MIKPILFNTEMVRAVLDGRKTVTRRIVKPQPMIGSTIYQNIDVSGKVCAEIWGNGTVKYINQPYHRGDILWVRETWCEYIADHVIDGVKYAYRANTSAESERFRNELGYKWRPSIHMPREAARTWLRVTGVSVEHLQTITCEEMLAEGISPSLPPELMCKQFGALWDSTIKGADIMRYGWDANPWVWRNAFERCEKPEGFDG